MQLNKNSKGRFVGLAGCSTMLGLVALAMLCPSSSIGVHAADTTTERNGNVGVGFSVGMTDGNGNTSKNQDVGVQFVVVPTISLGTGDSATGDISNIEVTAKADVNNGFATNSTEFMVSSNNSNGFSVYVSSENGGNLTNTATSADAEATRTIYPTAVAGGATQDSMSAGTWGYNLDTTSSSIDANTKYYSVLDNTNGHYTQSKYSNQDTNLRLTVGTKVNEDLQAGTYSNTITVSAVINPTTTVLGLENNQNN